MPPERQRHRSSLRPLPLEQPLSRPHQDAETRSAAWARSAAQRTGVQTSPETGTLPGQEFLCRDGWEAGEEKRETVLSRGGWAGACLSHIFTAGGRFVVGL